MTGTFTESVVEEAALDWVRCLFSGTESMNDVSHGQPAGRPNRRSIRLKGYDYSQPGAYFVTIVTQDRACLFGEVVDGQMWLNECGRIVRECWLAIPDHFSHTALDAFIIMPNHVHGIIWIVGEKTETAVGATHDNVGARHAVPLPNAASLTEKFGKPIVGSIPTIIRSFKSAATKRINAMRRTPGIPLWQRNYYEHIIRNEESLHRIRQYILENPMRWSSDRENPAAPAPEPEDPWRA